MRFAITTKTLRSVQSGLTIVLHSRLAQAALQSKYHDITLARLRGTVRPTHVVCFTNFIFGHMWVFSRCGLCDLVFGLCGQGNRPHTVLVCPIIEAKNQNIVD